MGEKLLEIVLENTFTLVDARRRVALLKEFLESIFFTHKGVPSTALFDTFFAERPDDLLQHSSMRVWVDKVFPLVDASSLYAIFEEVEKELHRVAVLTLYTPVPLPPSEYEKLCRMLRELTGKYVLIDDKVDGDLPAGGAFVWNGVYHDHSLRSRFSKEFEGFRKLVQGL